MGKKTGAWTADVTYDAAAFTAENLKQYDAMFLASTTGAFLDDPNDAAATAARRKALLDFMRGGKGWRHSCGDRSYHGGGRGGPGRGEAAQRWPHPAAVARSSGRSRGRRRSALARVQQNHRRLLQVPLELADRRSRSRSTIRKVQSTPTFKGKSFNINDEVYTFNQDSFSRDNVHVLTSIDYSLMSESDKKKECRSAPITTTG